MRPRILFGEHPGYAPLVERHIDHARFALSFAPLDRADFGSFDLVVPLRIDQIAAARAANADGRVRAVLPDDALVALCDDKLDFNRRLIALGFAALVPELLPDPPGLFPYVRKTRRGEFGDGVSIVRAAEDDRDPPPGSFCQRAVEGAYEYVLHLLRVGGRIRYAAAYRYLMAGALSVRGGAAEPLEIAPVHPGRALAPCAAILDALGYEGTCCFNYKYEAGALRILELNPRFGGSLAGDVNAYLEAHLAALAPG
jgi:hypothetical protein